MMKFKSLLLVALAFVVSMSSCSKDDDEPKVPVADQVVGSYTGDEVITIAGEPETATATFQFTKAGDAAVDMVIPQSGEGGMMVIPPLTVKNIPLSKADDTISGVLLSYKGTVTGSDGSEKEFLISDLAVGFQGKMAVVTYTLKYGKMPFDMTTLFNGEKK